jgi:hypothetical protein
MQATSSRSKSERSGSWRSGDAGIPRRRAEGVDEAQLCFFPFVAQPIWYTNYWYREDDRSKPVFHLTGPVARIALAMAAVRRSLRGRSVRPADPSAPAFESGAPQMASGWIREA